MTWIRTYWIMEIQLLQNSEGIAQQYAKRVESGIAALPRLGHRSDRPSASRVRVIKLFIAKEGNDLAAKPNSDPGGIKAALLEPMKICGIPFSPHCRTF